MKKEAIKELGKLIIDIGKLGVGGIIFASLIKAETIDKNILIITTLSFILAMFLTGIFLINHSSKDN